jgi:hypothetical protein
VQGHRPRPSAASLATPIRRRHDQNGAHRVFGDFMRDAPLEQLLNPVEAARAEHDDWRIDLVREIDDPLLCRRSEIGSRLGLETGASRPLRADPCALLCIVFVQFLESRAWCNRRRYGQALGGSQNALVLRVPPLRVRSQAP